MGLGTTYSDVLASPVTFLPPVNRGRPVDLKHSKHWSDSIYFNLTSVKNSFNTGHKPNFPTYCTYY